MEQLTLFGEAGQSRGIPSRWLEYHPGLIAGDECNLLLDKFIKDTHWKQHTVKMYDKEVITPRLTAWFGDTGSGDLTEKISDLRPWTEELLMIKLRVEAFSGLHFNSVLLNYYRDGNDSVAWHSDKESSPGRKTIVASVSVGAVRNFDLRNKQDHNEKYSIKLENGSFLLMKDGLQDHWEHRIAKSIKVTKARVNLTFRRIG